MTRLLAVACAVTMLLYSVALVRRDRVVPGRDEVVRDERRAAVVVDEVAQELDGLRPGCGQSLVTVNISAMPPVARLSRVRAVRLGEREQAPFEGAIDLVGDARGHEVADRVHHAGRAAREQVQVADERVHGVGARREDAARDHRGHVVGGLREGGVVPADRRPRPPGRAWCWCRRCRPPGRRTGRPRTTCPWCPWRCRRGPRSDSLSTAAWSSRLGLRDRDAQLVELGLVVGDLERVDVERDGPDVTVDADGGDDRVEEGREPGLDRVGQRDELAAVDVVAELARPRDLRDAGRRVRPPSQP